MVLIKVFINQPQTIHLTKGTRRWIRTSSLYKSEVMTIVICSDLMRYRDLWSCKSLIKLLSSVLNFWI